MGHECSQNFFNWKIDRYESLWPANEEESKGEEEKNKLWNTNEPKEMDLSQVSSNKILFKKEEKFE